MRVGFVGLGIMGRPMALNLLKAGHEVTVWARRQASMAPLIDAGAQGADSPAAVASVAEVVFSMVADAPDVRAVLLARFIKLNVVSQESSYNRRKHCIG